MKLTDWNALLGRPLVLQASLAATLLLCIVRLWIMPLPSSFWVDEMGTAFVVKHGGDHPSFDVAPQVPASLYYVLPKLADRLTGLSEAGYRIPSVLALIAALFFIGKIAARVIHPDAAWFTVFACLLIRDFDYQAADARPYALATLGVVAAVWLVIRWLDSGAWSMGLLFAIVAALTWRVHLTIWPQYLLLGAYAATRIFRRTTEVRWGQAMVVFGALGCGLVPTLLDAIKLNRDAAAHVFAPLPSWANLTSALRVGTVGAFCAVAALLHRSFDWPRIPRAAAPDASPLLWMWWLCAPVCLFLYSHITGNSIFVNRYFYTALPGLALSATALTAMFVPPQYWKRLALGLGVGILLSMGQWNRTWPVHHNSDWRSAAAALNRQSLGADVPVVCPSPFIEARPPVWRPDYPLVSFLYSHLQVYPLTASIHPFPYETSEEAERLAAGLTGQTLAPARRFVIYGGERPVLFWRNWFRARPELSGWRVRNVGSFGDVVVVVFEAENAVF